MKQARPSHNIGSGNSSRVNFDVLESQVDTAWRTAELNVVMTASKQFSEEKEGFGFLKILSVRRAL